MPPPTRAKSAIELAPNEKPVMTAIVLFTSPSKTFEKTRKQVPRPRTPRPTTPMPITEPPAKAISSAGPRPRRAAWVVRTFAFVATFIPISPARAEQRAPATNATAMRGWDSFCAAPEMPRRNATTTTKMTRTRYSARRKAMAPCWMAAAIFTIRSLPGSWRETQDDFSHV